MKSLPLGLLCLFLLLSFSSSAELVPACAPATKTAADSKRAETLLTRLDEIKAMDATTLSSAEKHDLRKEVRSIKSELQLLSGGVYLSVGGIIIIILLLILLL